MTDQPDLPTLEELKRHPFFCSIIDQIEASKGRDISADELRYLQDQAVWRPLDSQKILSWVGMLEENVDSIIAGKSTKWENHSFWLRLYGLFAEIEQYWSESHSVVALKETSDILNKIREIKLCFNEAELLSIGYFRNNVAHVLPSKYQASLDSNSNLISHRKELLTGKSYSVDKFRSLLKPVVDRHMELYLEYASRIQHSLKELMNLLENLEK